MIIGNIGNEKIVPEALGYDFAIELPSFYVLVNNEGYLYDIIPKNDQRLNLRDNVDEFNRKFGAQFLKELNDLYKLYKANEDRLWHALALAEVYRARLEAYAQGKLKIPQ